MVPLVVTTVALDGLGQTAYPCLQITSAFASGAVGPAKHAVRAVV